MEGLGLRVLVPGGVCPQVCRNAREVQLRVQPVRHVGGGMEGARVGVHVAERKIQGGRRGTAMAVEAGRVDPCGLAAERRVPEVRAAGLPRRTPPAL